MENEIMYIKLDDIIPNRFQPREVFDENALNKLAESIRQHGVIEPILVRPVSNKYEIIAGERRYKASILAGLTKIPAMVRQLSDKESSIIAFIENEHRSDVSAIEEAKTMDRILKANNMTQEELAKELGVNQSTIANKLRLLNLSYEVQEALMHNEISERHARSLLSVKDESKQIELLNKIKEKKMSVRELDSEIKSMNNDYNNANLNMNNGQVGNGFNYDGFASNPLPSNNGNVAPQQSNFMDSFSASNPLPPIEEKPVQNGGFPDFVNSYDNNPPVQNLNPLPQEPAKDANFPDFLGGFDMPTPSASEEKPPVNPGFMDFSSNNNPPITNTEPVLPSSDLGPLPPLSQDTSNSSGFMDFSDSLNSNQPSPIPSAPSTSQDAPSDTGFMDFLNNYDTNHPVQESTTTSQDAPSDTGFMDFLNNYDTNHPVQEPVSASQDTTVNLETMTNDNTPPITNPEPVLPSSDLGPLPPFPSLDNLPNDNGNGENASSVPGGNVMLNNVEPPITSGFANQYVENSENYVDITKQERINSVDEVIDKLGRVVKEIKEKSVYKVDTEEIDYDDKYQITITIDKRDF